MNLNHRLFVVGIVLIAFTFTATPFVQPAVAQSLEERIHKLEQELETDDESPFDSYVSEFGGRIMADWTFNMDESSELYGNSGAPGAGDGGNGIGDEAEDGFEFRRLRLYAEGPIGPQIDYKVQLDFADELDGNSVDLKDVYINYSGLPFVDNLKVGHFKEPFSLNELTSSKYITFMSRSALSDGFTPEYNPGVQTAWHAANDKYNFKIGVFNPQDDGDGGASDAGTNGSYNVTGRFTSPVVYEDNGKKVVHLGLSARQSSDQNGTFERDLEPEVHKGDPEFLEVSIPSENHTAYSFEAATVFGPLSVQGEYAEQDISTPSGSDPTLESWYLMGSYFLTGEHRPYDKADGDFGRVDVKEEWNGGNPATGAWEVAARWSETDFTEAQGIAGTGTVSGPGRDINQDGVVGTQADADALAGEMEVLTLGINWYPHEHAKWMLNYVDAEQSTLNGDAQWITTRFQVDF